MGSEGVRLWFEAPLFDGADQVDPPTRAVVLIARVDIGRTGLEAQSAMHAREEFVFL
jgi:hypothetical protein